MNPLAGFSEAALKLALDRFHLLQSHLEDKRPLKMVAANAGIPYRTAQRWVALYQELGLAGLARKKRTDTVKNRNVSVKIKEAIEGIALQKHPLSVTAICRQARRLAQDLGEEPPNYWAVYRIVSALPSDLVTLAHQGSKVYSDTFEFCVRQSGVKTIHTGSCVAYLTFSIETTEVT